MDKPGTSAPAAAAEGAAERTKVLDRAKSAFAHLFPQTSVLRRLLGLARHERPPEVPFDPVAYFALYQDMAVRLALDGKWRERTVALQRELYESSFDMAEYVRKILALVPLAKEKMAGSAEGEGGRNHAVSPENAPASELSGRDAIPASRA